MGNELFNMLADQRQFCAEPRNLCMYLTSGLFLESFVVDGVVRWFLYDADEIVHAGTVLAETGEIIEVATRDTHRRRGYYACAIHNVAATHDLDVFSVSTDAVVQAFWQKHGSFVGTCHATLKASKARKIAAQGGALLFIRKEVK